ncbi:cytochrome bc1 complex cytochrome b subunit [Spelaeicoccus albus]|uniref:Cytochrome bc1 complex cytochrome b subunit n=1 Tax=Spelaeicoccus albus TaxID=1280376 RepID=A0A7Z0IIF5_9MICO|nr:ubiquinol-cytochrome c reductase cytochrome b subunit [Spelaeicoccus albus]NYI68346.1 ubiquinol-cytochrome c reductase cytochrome b subunit [Spelaeicoccus albus]
MSTSTTEPKTQIGKAAFNIESRYGASKAVREFGRKIFPQHWSFMLGEIALYSFIILLLTGTFLTFFFHPAMGETVYSGPYQPLRGIEVSEAFNSTLNISFDVRGGLLMRQMHHWAALLFMAAMSVHMLRVFFTGAFRKPREMNWMIGGTLILLGMADGFTGYSLPDDLLSGNGLRIIDGIIEAIPLIGTYLSFFLFGGQFPGSDIVSRLYTLHILLVPAAILLMIVIHLFLVVLHKHTQYPGPGKTEKNVVGEPVLPVFMAKAGGFFFIIFGVIGFMGAAFTINPIWNYGPYDPSPISAGTQPDWYIGFMDGALRLMPGWGEIHIGGYPISLNILLPALGPVIVIFGLLFLYPMLEAWVTKDDREHHILDRPRNAPVRTGIGVAGVVWYCVMWTAAGSDVIAVQFKLSLEQVTYALRFLFFFGPVIAFWVTKRMCLALQRKDRETALHGLESGRIIRLPHGEYTEVHEQFDPHRRWELVGFESPEVIPAQPDNEGKVPFAEKVRGRLSRFFFEDRVAPVSPAELEAGHHGHEGQVNDEALSIEGQYDNEEEFSGGVIHRENTSFTEN